MYPAEYTWIMVPMPVMIMRHHTADSGSMYEG